MKMEKLVVKSNFFAEVLESSLSTIKAQCWSLDSVPAYGSLVACEVAQKTVYAIVYHCTTASDEGACSPYAYGKTECDLRQEHPEIYLFLKTTFHAAVIGYYQEKTYCYTCFSQPAPVHTFVRCAHVQEQRDFWGNSDAFFSLFGLGTFIQNLDDLLFAFVLQAQSNTSFDMISSFVQAYTLFFGQDYRRIRLFVQRLERIIAYKPAHNFTEVDLG